MYNSDLVETLGALHNHERLRLLTFLEGGLSEQGQKLPGEMSILVNLVFACLDKYVESLKKESIWASVGEGQPFDEDQLDNWIKNTTEKTQETIKKDLKKRIPGLEKDIVGMIEYLSIEERGKVISELKQSAHGEKEAVWRIATYYSDAFLTFSNNLDESLVYAELFSEKKPIPGKLAKFRTDVLKVVRKFIALEMAAAQMTGHEESVLLQKFFLERKSKGQYQRIRNHILKRKSEEKNPSPEALYQYFLSESLEYSLQNSRNEVTHDQNLWETIQSLDEYYLVKRLSYACELLNLNRLTPLALPPQNEWWLFDINSTYLKWFFEKPLGKLFSYALRFLGADKQLTETDFSEFTDLLQKNEGNIDAGLVTEFEVYAINYGISQVNKGNSTYSELVFNLQQKRAESGRISASGAILANEFLSIVVTGLRLEKYDWVKEFIDKNKKKVSGAMPSLEYYEFCHAIYLYHKKQRLPALQILMNSDYSDLNCKMAARVLEVKILCEMEICGETKLRISDQLDARIEAGILFFFRLKEIPAQSRAMRKRFMDFMKKIIRAKENRRWEILKKLHREVESVDTIAERQWLLWVISQYLPASKGNASTPKIL